MATTKKLAKAGAVPAASKEQVEVSKKPKGMTADVAPHSWLVSRWSESAPHVAPNTTASAKFMVRAHRDELVQAGALTRLGRDLVILGGPYSAWLSKRRALVTEYEIAPNKARANGAEEGTAAAQT